MAGSAPDRRGPLAVIPRQFAPPGPAPTTLELHRLTPCTTAAVVGLLPVVSHRYPGGRAWLTRRLDDALMGRARCTLATLGRYVAGATIETPKGYRRMKLSTLWVAPWARHQGVGGTLLRHAIAQWHVDNVEEAWLTVGLQHSQSVVAVTSHYGFLTIGIAIGRYREGESELILGWRPSAHAEPPQMAPT